MKLLKGILFAFFMLIAKFSFCEQTNSIAITGEIDKSILNLYNGKEVRINLYRIYIQDREDLSDSFITKIDTNGSFSFMLSKMSKGQFYISFTLINDIGNHQWPAYCPIRGKFLQQRTTEVFPIASGDSIHLSVQSDNYIKFTGKGSEKLQCQEQLLYCSAVDVGGQFYRRFDLINFANPEARRKATILQLHWFELQIQMGKEILKTYKDQLSPEIYNQLSLDLIANTVFDKVYTMHFAYRHQYEVAEYQLNESRYFLNEYSKESFSANIDSNSMAKSAYYADLLFRTEINKFVMAESGGRSLNNEPVPGTYTFKDIYGRFKNNYRGELREKLIVMSFLKLPQLQPEAVQFIDDALKITQDKVYKDILLKWKKDNIMAYPFELVDVNGKVHTLKEYKNKLLVIDFWFTGCENCVSLQTFMHPIYNRYKNNANVLFLSVNVDKDKKTWEKGLSYKVYTSDDEINLNTNGNGVDDPFTLAYLHDGCPQLMIIGKNGEMVSVKAPRPLPIGTIGKEIKLDENGTIHVSDENIMASQTTKDFIKIVDDYLKK